MKNPILETLFTQLGTLGIKTYSSEPLWAEQSVIAENLTGNIRTNDKYDGHALAIVHEGQVAYFPLKNGVATDKPSYNLVAFTATRDWEEYKIVAGATKVFAV